MNRRRLILWSLGAGQLLVAVAVFAVMDTVGVDNEWITWACVSFVYLQPYLIGIWIGLGRRSLPWRLLVVAACFTGLTWIDQRGLPGAVLALSPGTGAALALVLLARLFGLLLHDTTLDRETDDSNKLQFSLRSLLKWTAVTAVLCSLAAHVNPAASQSLPEQFREIVLTLVFFHSPIAAVLGVEFVILLGMRRPWIGMAIFLPLLLTFVALTTESTGVRGELVWAAGCLTLCFTLCMLPLRLAGYRFGRLGHQPKMDPSSTQEGTDVMPRRTIILWVLGAAQFLAAALVIAGIDWIESDWLSFACAVIVYAQPYFVGIWIGFGRRSLSWRILAVALCLNALSWIETDTLVLVLSPGIATALAYMLLARVFGFRLRDTTVETQAEEERHQFTLLSLLKWTTVIAVLCSLGALANPEDFKEAEGQVVQMILILPLVHFIFAGVAFTEFAILLGMRRPWIGLSCIGPPLLGVVALIGWSTGQMSEFLWGASCLMIWFGICVLPLRLLGYRFGRHHPLAAMPPASESGPCTLCNQGLTAWPLRR